MGGTESNNSFILFAAVGLGVGHGVGDPQVDRPLLQ